MSEDGKRRLIVGPFNRVEGDLEVRLTIADGRVKRAEVVSTLFRGFERMLVGRKPEDALVFVPRICGICSVSQSVAAARMLAALGGITPAPNGERAINLIHAAENAADHLTHFNLFFMADFTRPAYEARAWHGEACRRFAAGGGTSVRRAIEARAELLNIMGLIAGHWPHTLAIQPGGVTKAPDGRDRVRLIAIARAFRAYVERALIGGSLDEFLALKDEAELADWRRAAGDGDLRFFLDIADDVGLAGLGRGQDMLMSAGAYPQDGTPLFRGGVLWRGMVMDFDDSGITEDVSHAYLTAAAPEHPFDGWTEPDMNSSAAYSFCKAPRLDGRPAEVGALARQVIGRQALVRAAYNAEGANVRSRVLARLVELARLCVALEQMAAALDPAAAFITHGAPVGTGRAFGACEAARGTLGHWIVVEKGVIRNYQLVAPTTWNFSPRDETGQPGPLERALEGTPIAPDEATPVAVQHIVRSYDPCMVCTVH